LARDFDVATTYKREYDASVGMDAQGDYVISYTVQFNASDSDIRAALFGPGTSSIRTIDVAKSTRSESDSHVVVSANGAFSVSYVSSGTRVSERFTRNGQPIDGTTPPPTPPPIPQLPRAPLPLRGTIFGGFLQVAPGVD